MTEETFQRVAVDIPRAHMVILRRIFKGEQMKACVEKCVESFTGGWKKGVELSKECVQEVSSLLNIQSFNSESALIEAIRARFNLNPRSVVIDVDEALATKIRAKSKGNDLNFSDYVRRFVHASFRHGIMDWDTHTIFFDDKQYDRMKKAMSGVPFNPENLSRIVAEWRSYKNRDAAPVGTPEAPKEEKVLVVAGVNMSGDGKPAITGVKVDASKAAELSKAIKSPPPRGSQAEKDKLAAAMDAMVAKGSAKPKAVEPEAPTVETPTPPAEEVKPTEDEPTANAAAESSDETVYEVPTF